MKHVKAETCFEEVQDRSFKIWHFDCAAMVEETLRHYSRRLPTLQFLPVAKSGNGTLSPTPKLQYDWLVQLSDKPDMLQTRFANLQTHLDNLQRQVAAGRITMGGPTPSLPGRPGMTVLRS